MAEHLGTMAPDFPSAEAIQSKHTPFKNMRVVLTVGNIKINSDCKLNDISSEF